MRASLVVFAAALGLADAAHNMLSPFGLLNKRQGEAFDPGEETGSGATCVEAFGQGYIECRPESATERSLCYNPNEGQSCCNNLWGCPANSFCLVDGLCCPDGLDPKTCAAQNSVSLPPDFGVTTTTSTPAATESLEPTLSTTSAPGSIYTPSSSSTPIASTSPTSVIGNGTTTRTTSTSRPTVTAGAYQERAGIAAVVLGLAAAMVL